MLRPARSAVCRRGDDFCKPRVQVYGCWERHGLPLLLQTYSEPKNLGGPQALTELSADAKELLAEHRPVNRIASTNVLQLRFREWCVDGGGRRASLRGPVFGLQEECLVRVDACGTGK